MSLRDQDLELEAFNREFEVRADDRKFACHFDARLVEFLVAHALGCVVEAVGNRILIAKPAGAVPDVDALVDLALAVADRVPNAVKSMHPAAPAPSSRLVAQWDPTASCVRPSCVRVMRAGSIPGPMRHRVGSELMSAAGG